MARWRDLGSLSGGKLGAPRLLLVGDSFASRHEEFGGALERDAFDGIGGAE
ncbi:MAG: hypothetical protein WBN29_09060 [Polyangiales bacterium]